MIIELINQHADRLTQVGLHFLWQGTAIAILAALASRFVAKTPRQRSALFFSSLMTLALCVPATFMFVGNPSPDSLEPSSLVMEPEFQGGFVANSQPEQSMVSPDDSIASLPSQEPLTISFWITGIYFLGLVLMMSRVLLGYRWSHQIRRKGETVRDELWVKALEKAIATMRLRTQPLMIWSEGVTSPVVTGILRPMIVLPISLMSGLPKEQAIAVLSHELAHLRRFDHLVVVFQRFLEALFFFHPAVWFLSRRLDQEREKACDDLVLKAGHDRADYAEALVNLATDNRPAFALAAAKNTQLKERVFRILNHPQPATVRVNRGGWLTIASAIIAVGFLSLSPAQSEEEESAKPEKAEEVEISPLAKKLEIKIPTIDFTNPTVEEAIVFLRIRSIELDPEPDPSKKGLNFVIRTRRGLDQEPNERVIDRLVAQNFTIKQALDAICLKTNLQYKIDEFAVTITPAIEREVVDLSTMKNFVQREWKVPPNFLEAISAEGIQPKTKSILEHLKALDVPFPKTASVSLLTGSNTLIVRNTPENLDLIDKIVKASIDPDSAKKLRARAKSSNEERQRSRVEMAAHAQSLVQRKWKVPNFRTHLTRMGASPETESTVSRLKSIGVPFGKEASAAYVPKDSLLIVRNTPENLELIDGIVKAAIRQEEGADPKATVEVPATLQNPILNQLILPEIKLQNSTLEEAVEFLRVRSRELDPAKPKQGININVFGGDQKISERLIKILHLKNVPFRVALDYICDATDTRYRLEGREMRNVSIFPINKIPASPAIKPEKKTKEQKAKEAAWKKSVEKIEKMIVPEFKLQDATLAEAVELLQTQSLESDPEKKGVKIQLLGGEKNFAETKIVEMDLRRVPVKVILDYLCSATKTRYTVEGRNVSIFPKEK